MQTDYMSWSEGYRFVIEWCFAFRKSELDSSVASDWWWPGLVSDVSRLNHFLVDSPGVFGSNLSFLLRNPPLTTILINLSWSRVIGLHPYFQDNSQKVEIESVVLNCNFLKIFLNIYFILYNKLADVTVHRYCLISLGWKNT